MKTLRTTLLVVLALVVLALIAAETPASFPSRAFVSAEAHGDLALLAQDRPVVEPAFLSPELGVPAAQECRPPEGRPEAGEPELGGKLPEPFGLFEEPIQVACNCLACRDKCLPCTYICQPSNCRCFCNLC